MTDAKKLVSFRCGERDWEDFKAWADNQGLTATDALVRYIKGALGREPIITSPVMTSHIDDHLDKLKSEMQSRLAGLDQRLSEVERRLTAPEILESIQPAPTVGPPPPAQPSPTRLPRATKRTPKPEGETP